MDQAGAEFLQAIVHQRSLNLDTWNFFTSVHIAIAGLLFIINRRMLVIEKFVMVLGYTLFMILNISAQFDNYGLLDRMTAFWNLNYETGEGAAQIIAQGVHGDLPFTYFIYACYGAAYLFTVIFILFINNLSRKK